MRTKTYSFITTLFLSFIFSLNIIAQENELRPNVVLIDYLTGYCDEGAEVTFIDFIQKNAETLQPVLISIVNDGVPDQMIQNLQPELAKQYNERQRLLNSDLNFGLSEEDLELIRNESQEEFNQRVVNEYRNGFISQAIFGLSLIDTDQAQALVKEIAANEQHPYQGAAQNAVNKVYLKQE